MLKENPAYGPSESQCGGFKMSLSYKGLSNHPAEPQDRL